MNMDDGQRMSSQNHGMRKPMAQKYPEKNPNYSPSTSYNYSPQTGYNGNSQMFQRRRPGPPDRFRRDAPGGNDRLLRQNDIIIRLLKEIRDRLPQPAFAPATETEPAEGALEASTGASENWEGEDPEGAHTAEKTDETTKTDSDKPDEANAVDDSGNQL